MFDLKKLQKELDDLQELMNVAKRVNCLTDAERMSADKACKKYIKDNNLECLKEEVLEAFYAGFITYGRQKHKFESYKGKK